MGWHYPFYFDLWALYLSDRVWKCWTHFDLYRFIRGISGLSDSDVSLINFHLDRLAQAFIILFSSALY